MSSNMFSTIKQKVVAHHNASNAAFAALYGGPFEPTATSSSRPSSTARSNSDASSTYSTEKQQQQSASGAERRSSSVVSDSWKSIKNGVKEHHRATNAAYNAYYGVGSRKA